MLFLQICNTNFKNMIRLYCFINIFHSISLQNCTFQKIIFHETEQMINREKNALLNFQYENIIWWNCIWVHAFFDEIIEFLVLLFNEKNKIYFIVSPNLMPETPFRARHFFFIIRKLHWNTGELFLFFLCLCLAVVENDMHEWT